MTMKQPGASYYGQLTKAADDYGQQFAQGFDAKKESDLDLTDKDLDPIYVQAKAY